MIPPLGSVGLIRFSFCLHPCLHCLVLLSKTIDKSGSLNGDHLRFTGEFIWAVWSLLTFFFFFSIGSAPVLITVLHIVSLFLMSDLREMVSELVSTEATGGAQWKLSQLAN